ncbi:hypothetical protein F5876DRAFT_81665 [Lentinula aff. lateritia]|uniref:Uncharacterized protein n=1 Tax=Lentinula aff. lateritia TaxID=2804960 RepID=A0ACC1TLV7_9AGAR|nr:hypothetical protein F5876DRAFT_81665 [Lentinula aff. lateritia]
MSLSDHEQWHAREYHRCVYLRALDHCDERPEDPNLVYELVWAYSEAEAHPIPVGGAPLAAFPLDCYDLLLELPNGALSSLPRTALATAIGWNRALLQKLSLERPRSVIMFEEGDGESGSRMVVYFGNDRFYSFRTLLDAIGFVFEHWQTEPSADDRDGDHFGVYLLRANPRWEYEQVADHEEGVRRGWEWLGNV